MINPFIYGSVVTGKNFTNRKKEIKELINDIKNGQNIFIYSPRRYGKTSLMRVIQNKLEKEGFITIYLDFFQIYSLERFIEVYSKIIAEKADTKLEKIMDFLKQNLGNIIPSITVDNSGNPKLQIDFLRQRKMINSILEDVYELPVKLYKKKKKRILIVFDEFQEINNLNGESFEKELRSHIQYHEMISYVFMGSKTHILDNMFTDKSRALYKIGKTYPLRKIPRSELIEFILNKFKQGKYSINNKIAEIICESTLNHPYYTQMLCHEIWEISRDNKKVNEKVVDLAINRIISNQSELYLKIWESFSQNQKSLFIAFVQSGTDKIYSEHYREKNKLPAISTIQRSVRGLIEKGIIEKNDGNYEISDIFFLVWIKKHIL